MKVGNDVPEEVAQISMVRVTRGVAVPRVGRHQLKKQGVHTFLVIVQANVSSYISEIMM